ncbi:MAG: hypothetical protein RL030_2154, partial [Pseudomonadota bacterium]
VASHISKTGESFRFAGLDDALNAAAKAEGLMLAW